MNVAIARYTLITAMRDKLFRGLIGAMFLATLLALFLGSTSIVEEGQTAVTIAAATLRMIVIIGMLLFIAIHIQRSADNREIEWIISRPISRAQFVLSYFTGFALLALLVVLLAAGFMLFCMLLASSRNIISVIPWVASLYLEILVTVSFTMFLGLLSRNAITTAIFSLGFYFLARLIGYFLIVVHDVSSTVKIGPIISSILEKAIQFISIFFPRFDILTNTEWLIYGNIDYNSVAFCATAAVFYIPFVLSMTIFDLKRKQF